MMSFNTMKPLFLIENIMQNDSIWWCIACQVVSLKIANLYYSEILTSSINIILNNISNQGID